MQTLRLRFIGHKSLLVMHKSEGNALSEPTKLLQRLKIVHSFSAHSANDRTINKTSVLSLNTTSGIKMNRPSKSAFHKVPLPSVLNNREKKLLPPGNPIMESNKKNSQEKNKSNRNSILRSTDCANKLSKRSFSTLGRFLSTPNGIKNQEFLVELSQDILTNKIKKIVIMAGAGISCPSGIPDFRTPGSGLYDNLKQYKIPYPEAIFDIDYFMTNPKPFFTLAKDLFPSGQYRPNKVHYFFKLLQEKNLLLRVYTQNIDGLERLAGVTDSHLVEAHGTFASATCVRCGDVYSGEYVKTNIDIHDISRCSKCKGVVKPDIVFFGEDLPSRFHFHTSDFRNADLLLVMGTSLEVEPFASIVDSTRFGVPRILLNRQTVGVFRSKRRMNDHCLLGDIIDSIDTIVKVLRWETDLENVMEAGEKNKISFLDSVGKLKLVPKVRHFTGPSPVRRNRPALLPAVSIRSNQKKNIVSDDSSTDTGQSSSDSDSISS